MSKEPEILCPQCGARASVVVWFSDKPGEGFGSAVCPRCGGLDYKVLFGRVVSARLEEPEEESVQAGWEPSPAEYEEYLMDLGLRF